MSKTHIRVACEGAGVADIEQLQPTQGELKSLSKENYAKLRREIEETGFAFPFHVWRSDGVLNLIGGHQRLRVLKEMRAEGYVVPQLPVVYVDAQNLREAMRRVLQDVSQYGEVERQGLYEFMNHAGFGPAELAELFHIPQIDVPSFNAEFFHDDVTGAPPGEGKSGSTEYGEDDFSKFAHKCPRCGFGFDG